MISKRMVLYITGAFKHIKYNKNTTVMLKRYCRKCRRICRSREVCCRPGGHYGDTERAVAQWRRLVAFMEALDLLHWAMCTVLHCHTVMAIEMACNGRDAFVLCCRLFCLA